MSFVDDVDNILVRAHLSQVPRPVLVGGAALFTMAAVLILIQLGQFFFPAALEISSEEGIEYQMNDAAMAESDGSTDAPGKTPQPSDSDAAAPGEGAESTAGGEAEGQRGEVYETGLNEPAVFYVHITGAVKNPGVYPVKEGQRVTAAIEAAGGLTSDAVESAINLARLVVDGEQIYVPTKDEMKDASAPWEGKPEQGGAHSEGSGAGAGASGSGTAGSSGVVNLNTATVDELDTLPGVGPATAQRIVEDRELSGPFKNPEDLMRVSGIGEKKFAQLKDRVCV